MATYYWVGGSGTWDASSAANWSLTSGGLPGLTAPNNTDTVIFDSESGTGTCTTAAGSACAIATLNSSTLGLTLGANHTMSGLFTLTAGTLTLQSFTLTCNLFNSNNSNSRTIAFGTGNITLTGNNATVWTTSTVTNFSRTGIPTVNLTYAGASGTRTVTTGALLEAQTIDINVSAGSDIVQNIRSVKNLNFTGFTGTFNLNGTTTAYGNVTLVSGMSNSGTGTLFFGSASSAQQFTTAGLTLDFPITVGSSASAPILQFQDALTQGSTRNFSLNGGTVELKNGVTSTVGSFVATSPRPRTLRSTLAGSQATISQASGTVTAIQLSISDINATGGATWNARTDLGSKDITNNTGWNFIFIAVQQILKPIMAKILQPIILN